MAEQWKDIPGYEGRYQVSNLGRVKSLTRILENGNRWKGRILKPKRYNRYGHRGVSLRKDKDFKTISIHSLVLLAFVGPYPSGMEIRHYPDRNPHNNKLNNLKYGTKSENELDKIHHGTDNRGERNGRAKLSEKQVLEIRRLYEIRLPNGKRKYTQQQLAIKFGVSQPQIAFIVKSQSWSSL